MELFIDQKEFLPLRGEKKIIKKKSNEFSEVKVKKKKE